jgi:membrane-associated protein
MSSKRYLSVNAISGAVWAGGVTLAGALVGKHIAADKVDKVILPVVVLIIVVSVIPVVREALRQRREVSNGASQ